MITHVSASLQQHLINIMTLSYPMSHVTDIKESRMYVTRLFKQSKNYKLTVHGIYNDQTEEK